MNPLLILFITIILEFVVYLFFIKRHFCKLFLLCFLINAFTNPLANIAFGLFKYILFIEFSVFIVEIFLIKNLFQIKYCKSILISLIANLLSFFVGILIFYSF